jgi:DNA repair protein SbcD/Mre11
MREGIRLHYAQLEALCREKFPDVPTITCGHLYAQGAESSDSEREIQIGNQAAIDENTFGTYFQYVALGHIHRPQQVGKSGRVQYSGSPIALSISERDYTKRVIVVSIANNSITQSGISLSNYRELLLLEGSAEKIEKSIIEFNPKAPLAPMAEIRVVGTTFDPLVLAEKDRLTQLAEQKGMQVLQSGVVFSESERLKKEDRLSNRSIEELLPLDVLRSQFTEEDDTLRKEIESAFLILLERLGEKGASK